MLSRLGNKRYLVLLGILVLLFAFVSAVCAADMDGLNKELDKQTETRTKSPNLAVSFLKLIVALGLIVGAAWSILHILGKKMNVKSQGIWINVVDEIMLGQNRGIVLCEIGEKLYALGVTDHNINMLFEINNPKLLEEISQTNYHMPDTDNRNYEKIKAKIDNLFNKNKLKSVQNYNFSGLMEEQMKKMQELSKYYVKDGQEILSVKRSENNE